MYKEGRDVIFTSVHTPNIEMGIICTNINLVLILLYFVKFDTCDILKTKRKPNDYSTIATKALN